MLRGGVTQSERQMQEVLRSEAKDLLGRSSNGVSKLREKADEAIGQFGGWTWSPQTSPLTRQGFEKEFQTLFIDEYSRTGDEATAADLATKALQRTWGVTSVGSGSQLMKYPPEKVGYRAIDGSYDWIKDQAVKDMGLKPEENFDLFSDEQTRQEFQKFQQDPNAEPPSYRVFIKDANGVYRERTDERGMPLRMNFKPDEEVLAKEAQNYDIREEKFRLEEVMQNYLVLQMGAAESGQQLPEEETQYYEESKKRLEELNAIDDKLNNRKSTMEIFNDVNKPRGIFE